MPVELIVEDGTMVSEANSLVSLEYADSYHAYRGNGAQWTESDAESRKIALIRATDYICRHYRWKGIKSDSEQSLCWPREGMTDEDGAAVDISGIPERLKNGVCEGALRELSGPLDPDQERGGRVRREKVDVLEIEYSEGAPAGTLYLVLDTLVAPFIRGVVSADLAAITILRA